MAVSNICSTRGLAGTLCVRGRNAYRKVRSGCNQMVSLRSGTSEYGLLRSCGAVDGRGAFRGARTVSCAILQNNGSELGTLQNLASFKVM